MLYCFKSYHGIFSIIYSLRGLTCVFDSSLRRGPAGGRTGSCGGAGGSRATAVRMAQRSAPLLPFLLALLGYGEPQTSVDLLEYLVLKLQNGGKPD